MRMVQQLNWDLDLKQIEPHSYLSILKLFKIKYGNLQLIQRLTEIVKRVAPRFQELMGEMFRHAAETHTSAEHFS